MIVRHGWRAKGAWSRTAVALAGALYLLVGPLWAAERLVVISPHNRSITYEFGAGFARWHEREFGEPVQVEWRNLGGTADALKFVQSEFAAKPAGIGLDCFFGGGPEPYLLLADLNLLEPCRLPGALLAAIPREANGVELYDADGRWYGAALSSFGILQNLRVQRLLHLPQVQRWEELAEPALLGWVGVGDPRNSGTMNNMFEAFLQAHGWTRGWELLTCIAGNASKFDRLSSSTAKEVTLGETAYGFAIDFYGFSQVAAAGRTNLTFVLPEDFTAISLDGIAILKGAPNALTARRFLEFVLGEPGQKLWHLPRGHPEGAERYSIERMSVRPDLYARYRDVSNIAFSPFDLRQRFTYDARLARERREVVAALAGAILVDTHAELRDAWRAVIRRGATVEEREQLGAMPLDAAEALLLARTEWKDPVFRNRQRIAWQTWAQTKYRRLATASAAATAPSHEPTLTPALSRPTGEGARRAGEGKSGRFMADEQFRQEQVALHEPAVPGGARLLPSLVQIVAGVARQQPRPTRFMATEQVKKEQGTSHEPRLGRAGGPSPAAPGAPGTARPTWTEGLN